MNNRKILVVDDDPVVSMALAIKLKGQGYGVLMASDASEGITVVRKEKPDLILLDISFPPDMDSGLSDGFRIMEWLKRLDDATKIPVIVISAGAPANFKEKSFEERAKAGGAVAFFQKPINHEELFGAIRKTLGEESAA